MVEGRVAQGGNKISKFKCMLILNKQVILIIMQQSEHQELPQQIQIPESPDLYKGARNKFVTKVYMILAMQLLLTTGVVSITMNSPEFAKFQTQYFGLTIIAWIAAVACILVLVCKQKLSQSYPINMIILAAFTLCQSYIVSSICAMYDPISVLLAAGITASATIGLTLYAIFTKAEFTSYWQGLTGIGWSFVMSIGFLTIINFWIVNIPLISSLIALGFAVMYSTYLVIDTKLILGKEKHNLSLDNYVLGAMMLYLDIVGLFLQILRVLSRVRNN